jgi:hypothetical protein
MNPWNKSRDKLPAFGEDVLGTWGNGLYNLITYNAEEGWSTSEGKVESPDYWMRFPSIPKDQDSKHPISSGWYWFKRNRISDWESALVQKDGVGKLYARLIASDDIYVEETWQDQWGGEIERPIK